MRVSLSSLPSPAKTYTADFPKLTGGLNLWELDYRMDANQSPDMKNLWWQDGVLQCREGQEFIRDDTSLGVGYACYNNLFWDYAFFHIGESLYYGNPLDPDMPLTKLDVSPEDDIQEDLNVPENRGTFFRYLEWLFYKNRGGFFRISYHPWLAVPFSAMRVEHLAYTPVIQINSDPETGAGDLYQPENRLCPKKIVRYNAKADVKAYKLPVGDIGDVVYVEVDGEVKAKNTDYTVDISAGVVSFTTAPPATTPATNNTVEIMFAKVNADGYDSIMECNYATVAGGDQDMCILLGGCDVQPNAVFWNDRDNLSMNPTYFPVTYYNLVGDPEDPVTGFGRQYNDLIVLKERSVGKLTFGIETANTDGRDSISFAYTNINSKVGCDLPWSIQLIENNLVFCNTYQGVFAILSSSAAYENNVECISRNVNGQALRGLLHDVRQSSVVTSFDDDDRYWLCANGNVYAWDYSLSSFSEPSWFFFTNIHASAFFHDAEHNRYHLDSQGRITKFGRFFSDYGGAIEKVYQFPAQDFGSYDRLKDVDSVVVAVRSDTDADVSIRYDTDYETRYDLTPIQSYSWRLTPRNLAMRCLAVSRYAHVIRRRPGCRHVRHFSMTFSNNVAGCDLAIVSAQIFYKYQGRER